MRQNNCATDLLVCMTAIAAGSDMNFNGLIKFCRSVLFYKSDCICCIILDRAVYCFSSLCVFRSGIFNSAIFCRSALLMVATFVLFGTAEPDSILQAFFNRTAAGGVLVIKLKLLSAYTVMTTGMIIPA